MTGARRSETPYRTGLPVWVIVAMATLIGLNLRASLGSVPPLLDHIATDLDLNGTQQGLLTAVSIFFIGFSAPFGQKLARRIGSEYATAVVLGVLALGGFLRLGAGHLPVFLLSSAVTGAGMGGATVLMPGLIAHYVPRIRGFATGMYATGLALGVALGTAIAVPTEQWLGGWRPALALWGVITGFTALLWLVLVPRLRAGSAEATIVGQVVDHRLPWRNRTAWLVTWYTTSCMVVGFSGMAWVTPLYVQQGLSAQRAAGYFVLFQVVQLASMLGLPAITDHTRDRRWLLALVMACSAAGLAMLALAPVTLAIPAVALFGLGAGGGSTLALILLVDVTLHQADGARLNAMVMLVAYPTGAAAPLLVGFMHDLTGTFASGYLIILGVAVATLATVPVFHPGRSLHEAPPPVLPGTGVVVDGAGPRI
jgi:CP family cyanate transporter-like MFS transporter